MLTYITWPDQDYISFERYSKVFQFFEVKSKSRRDGENETLDSDLAIQNTVRICCISKSLQLLFLCGCVIYSLS